MSKKESMELVHNSLSSNVHLTGDMKVKGDLRFDGKVEGNLEVEGKLVLGKAAIIKGNLKCSHADIIGKIEGSLEISAILIVRAEATIEGDIYTKQLHIEPGATFNGKCIMNNEDAQKKNPILEKTLKK